MTEIESTGLTGNFSISEAVTAEVVLADAVSLAGIAARAADRKFGKSKKINKQNRVILSAAKDLIKDSSASE